MFKKNCDCLAAAIVSIIVGLIIGIISFGTVITGIVTAIWIALGIGLGSIVLLTTILLFSDRNADRCICSNAKCILIGAIGTIITAIIGLSITIVTGVIGIAILIGFGVFFLALTILSILNLLLCLAETSCKCRE